MRILSVITIIAAAVVALSLFAAGSANAGWLDKALKQAVENVTERAIDETANATYEAGKNTLNGNEQEAEKSQPAEKADQHSKIASQNSQAQISSPVSQDTSSSNESQATCAKATSLAGIPYAPKAEIRKGGEFSDMWQMQMAELQVPDQNAVCAPAYPGAAVVSYSRPGDPVETGKLQESARITLITPDPQTKVVAFYLDKLKGWHHNSTTGMLNMKEDYFWTGDQYFGVSRPVDMERPAVLIAEQNKEELGFMYGDLIPEANTTIEIRYPVE